MAELLTSREILLALEGIIKNAEKFICIFTYNIKIDENYLSRLRNASKRGIQITIVFGVRAGNPEVINPILAIPNIKVYFKEYLHAKFFYNEKMLLVGSMNLSEASGRNNFELGVLFKDGEYKDVIKKVKAEAKEIIDDAIEWANLPSEVSDVSQHPHTHGHCIRCRVEIKYDPFRPFCPGCYSLWSEWENEYYLESYCHRCSRPRDGISKKFPQCKPCYNVFIATVNDTRVEKNKPKMKVQAPPSESLDQALKAILAKHLTLKTENISIDMDFKRFSQTELREKLVLALNEIETHFQIKIDRKKLNDYWDLYSNVSSSIAPK